MTPNPHNLLLVSPLPPPPGGIALQSRLWARRMREDGWPVRCISSIRDEHRLEAWPGAARRAGKLALWGRFVAQCAAEVARCDAVVIATSSWLTFHLKARPVVELARRIGRPTVLWFKGGNVGNFLDRSGPGVVEALRRVDRLVSPSRFVADVFARYDLDAEIVPNVVDEWRFVYRPRPMRPIRGLVARALEPIYNNACAIRAWGIVRRRDPDAELWLAGRGPEEAMLRELAREVCPGGVRFLGAVEHDRMGEVFDRATCLVNPTEIDNMPNAVLEGQAAGLPVIATRVGGTPLLVDRDETGLLIERDDHEALAEAVLRLADDEALKNRIVEQAREAVRGYQWSTVGPRWHGVIEAAVARHRGGAKERAGR